MAPQLSRLSGITTDLRHAAAVWAARDWRPPWWLSHAAARLAAVAWSIGIRPVEYWRRSLQVRVVATTLLVSATVVVALGVVLVDRISDGLVDTKRSQAINEVENGQSYALGQLQALGGTADPDLVDTLRTVVANLSTRGAGAGRFTVAIRTDPESNIRLSPLYVAPVDQLYVEIPERLSRLVEDREVLAYQFVRTSTEPGAVRPFLVVGAPVATRAGSFQLYYFFPLDDEVAAVELVQNTLIAIGALLLFLLAAIVAILTRQVVTPVRLAARTAERLSAGLLEERMTVRGEDDLARLAHSFNQMAANLQRQIVQLEDLSRLQRRFTSDVSHELRTPLTTVRMAADVLHAARDDFEPGVARSAELLQTEVDRFEGLLTDLLEISRYDGGFAVLDPEVTDVRVLVRRVVQGLEPVAELAGVELQTALPNRPVVAEVDARRVERILRNLIGNAVEHGERKPVRVTLAQDDSAVAVTVRDHGVGLKPGEAQVVFNRFWRADPSRARQTGGTGLGLSISLEDARLHGGWLQAWGEPGHGAVFRLTLPAQAGGRLTSSPLPLEPTDRDLELFDDHYDGRAASGSDQATGAVGPAAAVPAAGSGAGSELSAASGGGTDRPAGAVRRAGGVRPGGSGGGAQPAGAGGGTARRAGAAGGAAGESPDGSGAVSDVGAGRG